MSFFLITCSFQDMKIKKKVFSASLRRHSTLNYFPRRQPRGRKHHYPCKNLLLWGHICVFFLSFPFAFSWYSIFFSRCKSAFIVSLSISNIFLFSFSFYPYVCLYHRYLPALVFSLPIIYLHYRYLLVLSHIFPTLPPTSFKIIYLLILPSIFSFFIYLLLYSNY